ncbi:hypothetical protein M9H77_22071 [Catharanthus roseus]|uniref:Uncharacterized protein n=1 Tax=Catharanthus roseus TaxID=4058 RepID=A0ACC0AS21_CATRO|nr:hypothetical protein M9H77_22071 [Catharanthus roseus]
MDRDRCNGPIHVYPSDQRRLQAHHLYPNAIQSSILAFHGCPLGRFSQSCGCSVRYRLLHRRIPLRCSPRPSPPDYRFPCRPSSWRVLIDMTTSDPSLAVEIHSAATSAGCSSIDAPVSGGDRGAKNATLSIFAGGDEKVVQKLNPIFSLLGKVYYMGGPGKGQYAKLANQITIASTMVGLCEGLVYAHKAGLDLSLYLSAISTGAAGSKSLDLYGSRILKRDFGAGFYVNHFVKDLGICLRECQNMTLALPGLALAQQLYLSLKAYGEGDLGTQALILALERLNNVALNSESSAAENA